MVSLCVRARGVEVFTVIRLVWPDISVIGGVGQMCRVSWLAGVDRRLVGGSAAPCRAVPCPG